jgi:hypothetical protein
MAAAAQHTARHTTGRYSLCLCQFCLSVGQLLLRYISCYAAALRVYLSIQQRTSQPVVVAVHSTAA